MLLLCVALLLLPVTVQSGGASNDQPVSISVEEIVESVARKAQSQLSTRQERLQECTCSQHVCSNNFEGAMCTAELGNNSVCSGCGVGLKIDFSASYVTTPPGLNPTTRMPPHVGESICIHQGLDEVFTEVGERERFKSWTYFGTTSGVMRMWPAKARERGLDSGDSEALLGNCRSYDPRLRPWYSQAVAAGGTKDVVILLDTSVTMAFPSGEKTRLSIAKELAISALTYIHSTDHLAVVPFGSDAEPVVSHELIEKRMNPVDTHSEFVGAIRAQKASGRPNVVQAFAKAFDLLADAVVKERASDCQKIILFISDGHLCQNPVNGACPDLPSEYNPVEEVIEAGEERLLELNTTRATIFTFSIGKTAQNGLMRRISCGYGGVWTAVSDTSDPLYELEGFVSVLASKERDTGATWSSFYLDDAGLGQVTTATKLLFSYNYSGQMRGRLAGVVGHDITVSHLADSGISYHSVVGKVADRMGGCNLDELSVCSLQAIRGDDLQCPDILSRKKCYSVKETNHVYVHGTEKLTHEEAVKKCSTHGGYLVQLDSTEEIALAGGLAAPSGSWIGIKLVNGTSWQWDRDESHVDNDDDIWAPGYQDPLAECGSVDNRGIRKNAERRPCGDELFYICEFESLHAASQLCALDNTVDFDNRQDASIPSLAECLDRFGNDGDMENGDISSEVKMKIRRNVDGAVCDLGVARPPRELMCCGNCSDEAHAATETSQAHNSKPMINTLCVLLLSCWTLLALSRL